MSSAMPQTMTAKAGRRWSVFTFILLFTAAHSTSSQPHFDARHMSLGLPNLPPGLFITYTGVLTGSFQLDTSQLDFDAAQCAGGSGTYFFEDTENSTLRVGLNPPSVDANPIFFMVQQGGPTLPPPGPGPVTASPTPTQAPTEPARPMTWTPSFTLGRPTVMPIPIFSAVPRALHPDPGALDIRQEAEDPVLPPGLTGSRGFKNLLFASLYTICTHDSLPCGMIRAVGQGTEMYDPMRMLDLTPPGLLGAATAPEANGAASYTLRGDQSTWMGNETIEWSGLEFSPPANYTPASDPPEPEACTAHRWPPLVWNATTPFTYDLTFSNTSATISLVLTAPLGTATLRLEAARALDDMGGPAEAIQVGAGAGGAPRWSFVNGTGFHFDGATPVANASVADGGLFNGQDGLGSGAGVVLARWGGWFPAAVAVVFTALLI
ncbi:hypothetical protein KVR01_006812 [Diaporthe batatas]|uniref:uncharacterized protein n=1 Tax=Diaporthe batatas TaxID=748121 RepID=UPI001D051D17|nr:uncharacterized protein KVR01_006812 [Diaporthe batatas]KAG8163515.1 hypothetical protein KVR01_006812 [Diaporthe batatas]